MRNELISFETALLAKEKGFKEKTWYRFIYVDSIKEIGKINRDQSKGDSPENWNNWFNNEKIKFVSIPYQSFLQRWLREKYKIHIIILPHLYLLEKRYEYRWTILEEIVNPVSEMFKSYEEALEQGLIQGLKLIK